MFFSNITMGFYSKDINDDNIPDGAVEITEDKYTEMLSEMHKGKIVSQDDNGKLVLIDPPGITAAQVWEHIKAERDRRTEIGGFQCGGKWYHSDLHSKAQLLGNKDTARDQIAAGGVMTDALFDPITGHQIVWKTMDGTWQPLTCQLAFDIVKAGKGSEFAHYAAAEIHHAAMIASGESSSYDFSSGWPQIFEEG